MASGSRDRMVCFYVPKDARLAEQDTFVRFSPVTDIGTPTPSFGDW